MGIPESTAVVWCFIPARSKTSEFSSDIRCRLFASRRFASRLELLDRFSIHMSVSWVVRVVSRLPPKYDDRCKTAKTIVRHSLGVLPYLQSASLMEENQRPMGFIVSFRCFWSATDPICVSQAFLMERRCSYALYSAASGGYYTRSFQNPDRSTTYILFEICVPITEAVNLKWRSLKYSNNSEKTKKKYVVTWGGVRI